VHTLESILVLYAWVASTLLVVAILLIARFYELKSGKRTYYKLFCAPAVFFPIAGIRCAFFTNGNWVGDDAANLLSLCGSVVVLILGHRLLRLMTGRQQ